MASNMSAETGKQDAVPKTAVPQGVVDEPTRYSNVAICVEDSVDVADDDGNLTDREILVPLSWHTSTKDALKAAPTHGEGAYVIVNVVRRGVLVRPRKVQHTMTVDAGVPTTTRTRKTDGKAKAKAKAK